jgi:hypothetical protein
MAAAIGNQYAAKAKMWADAIKRALDKRGVSRVEALDVLAEQLLAKCEAGDLGALKELGDRLDGKPAQSVTLAGDEDKPLELNVRTVQFVKPDGPTP